MEYNGTWIARRVLAVKYDGLVEESNVARHAIDDTFPMLYLYEGVCRVETNPLSTRPGKRV